MKLCKKCDTTKPLTEFSKAKKNPDGLQYWCKDCMRQNTRERVDYYARRKIEKADQISQQRKDRYATDAEYRERKKELARNQKFNPDYKEREHARYYRRAADPAYQQKKSARLRERRHTDPEYRRKVSHYRRARQARIQLQGKPFTHAEWVALCERYNHLCLCCGQPKPLSPDHVIPISKGGSSDIDNIQPLCVDCNKRKNARTIDYRPAWGG